LKVPAFLGPEQSSPFSRTSTAQQKIPDLSEDTVARKPAKETVVVVRRKRKNKTKLGIGHHHHPNPEDAEGVEVGELAEGQNPKSGRTCEADRIGIT